MCVAAEPRVRGAGLAVSLIVQDLGFRLGVYVRFRVQHLKTKHSLQEQVSKVMENTHPPTGSHRIMETYENILVSKKHQRTLQSKP